MAASPLPLTSPPPPPPLQLPNAATVRSLTAAGHHAAALRALSSLAAASSTSAPLDRFALPPAAKSAAALRDARAARAIHCAALRRELLHGPTPAVANALLTAYARCGDLPAALALFGAMGSRDAVTFNSLIAALCLFRRWLPALDALRDMLREGHPLTSFTLVSVLLACSHLVDDPRLGREAHAFALKNGFLDGDERFAFNALLSMYARLGLVDDARRLFGSVGAADTPSGGVVTWNTMVSLLVQSGRCDEAIQVLYDMVARGVRPDGVTFASALPACSQLEMLAVGREMHAYVLKDAELAANSFVASALVDMYASIERVAAARRVFDMVPGDGRQLGLWNAMVCGYAQAGMDEDALDLFSRMEAEAGVVPSETTMAGVLPACARSEAFAGKEAVHGYVLKRGMANNRFVQNALMDMYARLGDMDAARRIFGAIEPRDVVSWNTLITGCVVQGHIGEAFQLVREMQQQGRFTDAAMEDVVAGVEEEPVMPNNITLMTLLPGCAMLVAPARGKEIHGYAVRHALDSDVAVGSALVDMYAKCGCLVLSRAVFDRLPRRNVITWNVLIMAYGMHGLGDEAIALFDRMVASDEAKPNEVTFIAALAACSHSGMVDRGLELFHGMKRDHGVEPTPDLHACAVDILGRAGRLDEAYSIINSMEPGEQQVSAWSCFLGACRLHRNVQLGEIAAERLFQLEPDEASHYVLLCNIYSAAGLWEKSVEVRKRMRQRGVSKEPGCSWIELDGAIHRFMAGESTHPESVQVHEHMDALWERMRIQGYKPDTSCVLHDIDDSEKAAILRYHSEKLAIAFGLLRTPPGAAIRVAKNLRVCNDCHESAKFISKMVGREIVLRDVRRFHYFRDGTCSCGDYW
ncbi:pentatricopeptide repeat-containing protein At3g57430, chloroplastic [Phragmites australis]|uniref:pentatricopeptide repeat-containing protein At3g57430, chloroplastic n=1 Tax=Phragmites australis TaxID=29695 RepID=UPI002D798E57|nr:pentatricopeptide repeat-containing protein At3g57430, chloroplastic [Phragmites australis]